MVLVIRNCLHSSVPYPELRYLLYVIGKMFSFPYAEIWLLTLLKAEGRQIFKQTPTGDVTYPVGATSLSGPSIDRTALVCGILFYLFFVFAMEFISLIKSY